MCVYEDYVNKKVKCVWKDGFREKAVVGVLQEFDSQLKLLTILSEQNNRISIKIDAVITIAEYVNRGTQR